MKTNGLGLCWAFAIGGLFGIAPECRAQGVERVLSDQIANKATHEKLRDISGTAISLPPSPSTRPTGSSPDPSETGLFTVVLTPRQETLSKQVVQSRIQTQSPGTSVPVNSIEPFPNVVRDITEERALNLKAYAYAASPMRYVDGAYVAQLAVGVIAIGDARSQQLSRRFTFQVLDQGISSPSELAVDRTSPPYKFFTIRTTEATSPYAVQVASEVQSDAITVQFDVKPALMLRTDKISVQGYGLETTRLFVTALGLDRPEGRVVNLQANPTAHISESRLTLDASGNAETVVRSDGTGPVVLTVSGVGLSPAEGNLRFLFPYTTLVAAILGGLIGGLIRMIPVARSSGGFWPWVLSLVVAVLVGGVVFVIAVLGVNLLPIEFNVRVGQVFVFGVSALGAFVGAPILKRFVLP